jgi:hypothetical protein
MSIHAERSHRESMLDALDAAIPLLDDTGMSITTGEAQQQYERGRRRGRADILGHETAAVVTEVVGEFVGREPTDYEIRETALECASRYMPAGVTLGGGGASFYQPAEVIHAACLFEEYLRGEVLEEKTI